MSSGHRSAHVIVVLAAAVVGGGALAFAWAERSARAVPEAASIVGPAAAESVWEVALETPAGTARLSLEVGAAGPSVLRVWLPLGLDAAEPGVVLEVGSAAPRVLGSVRAGKAAIPLAESLPDGGLLVLTDLARGIRLGEAAIPEGGS